MTKLRSTAPANQAALAVPRIQQAANICLIAFGLALLHFLQRHDIPIQHTALAIVITLFGLAMNVSGLVLVRLRVRRSLRLTCALTAAFMLVGVVGFCWLTQERLATLPPGARSVRQQLTQSVAGDFWLSLALGYVIGSVAGLPRPPHAKRPRRATTATPARAPAGPTIAAD